MNDDNDGLSPRITSIAVAHYATEQSVSFSTHAVAEELGIKREDVLSRFDDVEKELLTQFYRFIRDRRDKYWIHWNMRNATYGFEHIEHRYRVLGCADAPIIPVERRINLNDMIAQRYGKDYAKHPKLPNLMDLNGGKHRDFLSGDEEVAAFKASEFMRMHKSTLCKVGFFQSTLQKLKNGKLKTSSRGWGILLDRVFESRLAKALGLAAGILTLGVGFYQIEQWIHPAPSQAETPAEIEQKNDTETSVSQD
ncbi:hypothetical protein KBY24_06335 [Ruegeria pomeroyi]|nr:hypothetical protein [Ruegeria pomeroyi]